LTHTKHISPFVIDAPFRADRDKPRAHLTGKHPCVFLETTDHNPEIFFNTCIKIHSSGFSLKTIALGNRPFDQEFLDIFLPTKDLKA
jgi:hypothetical protein